MKIGRPARFLVRFSINSIQLPHKDLVEMSVINLAQVSVQIPIRDSVGRFVQNLVYLNKI